ncbi:hypothetical protein ACFFSY_24490 [Paenibacillus aurantiacus]|uniref:Inhibitor of sigma-G Gin n=1 Tax=Paenibacillus aurantiacus TaxID=1936118 RepID=A0ABV5KYG1_9BACL
MMNNQPFRMLDTTEVCFSCGERLDESGHAAEERAIQGGLLCPVCAEASGKSSAHYYMMQYYYRFAD